MVIPVVASGPLLVILGLILKWLVIIYIGALCATACCRALLVARQGRVELWPDGLTNRAAGRPVEMSWERVERLVVIPTLLGRQLAVDESCGRRTVLAAPRSGALFDGRAFTDDVERIRRMPGGGRTPPRVFTSPGLGGQARQARLVVILVLGVVLVIAFVA